MTREPIFPNLVIILFFFFSISFAIDILTPSHPLSYKETLISANGTFALGFFTPPNTTNSYIGIWYHNLAVQTVVWVANRRNPIHNINATLSIIADDASLHLITSGNSTPLWSSPSFPNSIPNPVAQLLDTGNLIIRASNSSSHLWQSFDYPTDTLLSGMKLGPELKIGIDRNLTAWLSNSDPSPGKYSLAIDTIGVPQLVIRDLSGSWIWRGGPWNGFGFTGACPKRLFSIDLYRDFNQGFNSTPEEIFFYYNSIGDAISTLTMDQKGVARIYHWKASSQNWNLIWFAPSDPCDFFPACGTNAICDSSSSPMCQCLGGFNPKNPVSWSEGNWSDGCVRGAALGCGANGANETDEFLVVRGTTLPDTTAAVADMSLGLVECKTRCLMNCSCKAYASVYLNGGGGFGCIVWMTEIKDLRSSADDRQQDLFVRIASSANGSNGKNKKKTWIFVTMPVASILLLLIVLICALVIRRWKRRRRGKKKTWIFVTMPVASVLLLLIFLILVIRRWKRRKEEEQLVSSVNWGHEIMHEANKEGNSEISFFKFAQVVSATNNFSDINKLGEGGFGPVYKGKLPEGQDVAIKRLSARSGQGLEEFKNEILLIAKLQHRNLVRLLGCCIHGEEKMLIYEFMPNKSLDLLLFDVEQRLKLYWTRRFQIIEGIAQGLLYLHKHSRLRIIHRDLKASNILLDGDMNPKISDFGMARIFDSNDTQANTRRIVGTFGYMSPEYALNGLFSVKSDVYSFGVLLLEIVSGRRNHGSCNLLAYAWGLWKEGTWAELVDPSLDNKFQNNEVARCIYVALLCVQERPEDRPFMSDIVTMLANESLYFNSIKQPAFFTIDNDLDARNPLNQHVSTSFNDLSISIVAGR
ncbi:G-type lectin S-receptor-like serine/threonine-protein kinase At4g27290 [Dendrobium catenatum]|uniref:G-type lectin S-receptor-like serine/threonine-protein kinase At4g27290 n=1 Tax=Dendrobium catenatum TaxID=906689 RepID=UPI0010A0A83D|nr:G-type lectin S-receptor-like serine/threonine-protein kinase At4g27290 [Dendrobium catenatum]